MELLATDEEDPLLAFWPIGLGRTAVFASDVKDRWAADWVKWRGYGPFFAAVVRALAASAHARRSRSTSRRADPRRDADDVDRGGAAGTGRQLSQPLHPARAGASRQRQGAGAPPTRQVAPGPLRSDRRRRRHAGADDHASTAPAAARGITSRTILPDPAAEYRFRAPDEPLLMSIASSTGGAWRPDAAGLANAAGDSRTERRPLWPTLVALALVLWFVDLLLRRVRVFEPSAG